jgi:hypothetical protein
LARLRIAAPEEYARMHGVLTHHVNAGYAGLRPLLT